MSVIRAGSGVSVVSERKYAKRQPPAERTAERLTAERR